MLPEKKKKPSSNFSLPPLFNVNNEEEVFTAINLKNSMLPKHAKEDPLYGNEFTRKSDRNKMNKTGKNPRKK